MIQRRWILTSALPPTAGRLWGVALALARALGRMATGGLGLLLPARPPGGRRDPARRAGAGRIPPPPAVLDLEPLPDADPSPPGGGHAKRGTIIDTWA